MNKKLTDTSADRHNPSLVVDGIERKELFARMAALSSALGLEKASSTGIGAVGANVMDGLGPRVVRLHDEYQSARSGRQRVICALKFKATLSLYHFAFKITKGIQKRQLRKLGLDQLIEDFRRQFGHLDGRDADFISALSALPELLRETCAALDEIDRQLCALNDAVHIHPNRPVSKLCVQPTTKDRKSDK